MTHYYEKAVRIRYLYKTILYVKPTPRHDKNFSFFDKKKKKKAAKRISTRLIKELLKNNKISRLVTLIGARKTYKLLAKSMGKTKETQPKKRKKGLTNLDVARKLAYTYPQRPFGRDFRHDMRNELQSLLRASITLQKSKKTIRGKRYSYFELMQDKDFARKVLTVWQAWIYDGSYYKAHAPNSPNTIKKDPSHTGLPLVDTTQLINALSCKKIRLFPKKKASK